MGGAGVRRAASQGALVLAADPDLVRNGVAVETWGDGRALLGEIGGAENGVWAHTAVMMVGGRGLASADRLARLARARPLAASALTAAAVMYGYRHRGRLGDPEVHELLRKTRRPDQGASRRSFGSAGAVAGHVQVDVRGEFLPVG
jgi:hypothetical protein